MHFFCGAVSGIALYRTAVCTGTQRFREHLPGLELRAEERSRMCGRSSFARSAPFMAHTHRTAESLAREPPQRRAGYPLIVLASA